ncbi:ribosomal protein L5 [Auriculariales sp. MPI-PUGE-AT-0066]|nr:ribosomal protein L5 [Auriculariales sp. MPI-PUGE-AT-0066]
MSKRVLKAGISAAPAKFTAKGDTRRGPFKLPRFLRPPPRQFVRTKAVVREEWRSRTVWPQRERWHNMKIMVRETSQSRVKEHYNRTVADNMMYMQYLHEEKARGAPVVPRGLFDTTDPYTKNRFNPIAGGDRFIRKRLPPSKPENVAKLDKIVLHTFQKEAIGNKSYLLGCIAAFRALSGESVQSGGRHTGEGIKILRGRKTVGGWIRPGIACGIKVELKGDRMYDFLGTFTEFVLPRLRDFNGFQMEPQSKLMRRQSAVSGVVSVGLHPSAMGFFPQIECNVDAYPKMYGMHIHFVTTTKGQGAQNLIRGLMSGFQIPFRKA